MVFRWILRPRRQSGNAFGPYRIVALIADVDYGITDTISLTLDLPFHCPKYTGLRSTSSAVWRRTRARSATGRITAHFRDVRVEVRRLFWAGGVPTSGLGGASPSIAQTCRRSRSRFGRR
jgi:hypothetical protein